MNEWMNEWINKKWMNEWMNVEKMNEWTNEWMNDVNKGDVEAIGEQTSQGWDVSWISKQWRTKIFYFISL